MWDDREVLEPHSLGLSSSLWHQTETMSFQCLPLFLQSHKSWVYLDKQTPRTDYFLISSASEQSFETYILVIG